ncbi:MAG: single-stranded DNA-binding protein [Clostridium sp.]|nr:single-stranded DNA-binding protein [Clostridium sp.]
MNNTILLGRITKDPEIRETKDKKPYCRFTLAVDRNDDNADFIPCIAWGDNAVNMDKYVMKGRQLLVQGKLQSGSYEDKDGVNRYTLDLFVYRVKFLAVPKGYRSEAAPDFTELDGFDDALPF